MQLFFLHGTKGNEWFMECEKDVNHTVCNGLISRQILECEIVISITIIKILTEGMSFGRKVLIPSSRVPETCSIHKDHWSCSGGFKHFIFYKYTKFLTLNLTYSLATQGDPDSKYHGCFSFFFSF